MNAAADDLEFVRGRQWQAWIQRSDHARWELDAWRLIGNYVINHRGDFGLMEIEMALSKESGICWWVMVLRREAKPDRIHLLACLDRPFEEIHHDYFKALFHEG